MDNTFPALEGFYDLRPFFQAIFILVCSLQTGIGVKGVSIQSRDVSLLEFEPLTLALDFIPYRAMEV